MLVSVDAAAGACPECGMDAGGRAALAHRSAQAMKWAGAALGAVASIELLEEVHRWAARGILALTTNEESRAAITGELASFDTARVWVMMIELLLVLAAGIAAWRIGGLRRSPRGASAWLLGALAIAIPAVELVAVASARVAPGSFWFAAGQGALTVVWTLAGLSWCSTIASGTAAAWLASAPPVRRPRGLGTALWIAIAMMLLGTMVIGIQAVRAGSSPALRALLEAERAAIWPAALAALFALRSWPHVHEQLPEHRPGDVVTLRHAMHIGGTVLGWALAMVGVLAWIVVRSKSIDFSGTGSEVLARIPWWMVARDVLAMLFVAAWVIPAFLVPDPRAAKTWKLAALISGAAAVLFAGR